jgi:hypothetical protein
MPHVYPWFELMYPSSIKLVHFRYVSSYYCIFLFTCRVLGVEANVWFEKKIVFTSWSAYVRSLCKGVLFFLSNTAYERSWTIFFFICVLDIWMEMIYDLVTNGLARLNLPLELNFLCIGLCQIILVLWFFMHYVHENIVVGNWSVVIFLFYWKKSVFSWFSKTLFSIF